MSVKEWLSKAPQYTRNSTYVRSVMQYGTPFNNNNRRDCRIRAELLNKILIADPGAISEGAKGGREDWISEWSFD